MTIDLLYEKMGRYRTTIILLVVDILVSFLYAFKGIGLIYFLRFVSGYAACSWSLVAPLMIKENLPQSYKNIYGSSFGIFLTLGVLISFISGNENTVDHWRLVFMLPLLIELPKFILFVSIFKMRSPNYLYNIYSNDMVKTEEILEKNYSYLYDKEASKEHAFAFIKEKERLSGEKKVGFKELVSKYYRIQFGLVITLNILNQMTGINFLILYSSNIFE